MSSYDVVYRWSLTGRTPVLHIRVSGSMLSEPSAIPAIIDGAHAYVDQNHYQRVNLAYDITRTERRLPVSALMRRSQHSRRVQRIAIIGAGARTDEMAVLISCAAKGLSYTVRFFDSVEQATPFLYELDSAPALQTESSRS